jgi:hypothetical protein
MARIAYDDAAAAAFQASRELAPDGLRAAAAIEHAPVIDTLDLLVLRTAGPRDPRAGGSITRLGPG